MIDELRAQSEADVRAGIKPDEARRCGIEYEVMGFERAGWQRLNPSRVVEVLHLLRRADDKLIYEDRHVIGLETPRGYVTVEPGGQIEFSSSAHASLLEVDNELRDFLERLRTVGDKLNIVFAAIGFDPQRRLDEQQWFPKKRYEIMRDYFQRALTDRRGADMMTRTCAVQASFDFTSEPDFARKLSAGIRLAPVVAAIFSNAPVEDRALSRYRSVRQAVWLATDVRRTGAMPFVYRQDFLERVVNEGGAFAAFADYVWSVPMLFVRRDGKYQTVDGTLTFEDFARGIQGDKKDFIRHWREHLTTIFTDVRVKNYLEMRMADSVAPREAMAFAALWKGLLYAEDALDACLHFARRISLQQARELAEQVAREGLAARVENIKVLDVARELVKISLDGLKRQARIGANINRLEQQDGADDETKLLDVLQARIIERGVSPADELITSWNRELEQDTTKLLAAVSV